MSNHNTVEITGNIIVHHPSKKQAEVIIIFVPSKDFGSSWSTELPIAA